MKKGELVTLRAAQALTIILSTAFLVATVYAIVQVSIGNVHPGAVHEV
jgi:hypothetical protein